MSDGSVITPAGVLHLADVDGDLASQVWAAGATPATTFGTMRVLVTPVLPIEPSPAEVARRIVRHGAFAARKETGYGAHFADSLGDVGPKPGDKIRAIQIHGALYVDAQLAEELKAEGARARERAWAEGRERAKIRIELQVIAQMVDVPRVVAYQVDHKLDQTLYRIPTGEDLAGDWAAEAWIDHEDLRRAGDDWQRRKLVATRLRAALVEAKLDDEEAARS